MSRIWLDPVRFNVIIYNKYSPQTFLKRASKIEATFEQVGYLYIKY